MGSLSLARQADGYGPVQLPFPQQLIPVTGPLIGRYAGPVLFYGGRGSR